MKAKHQTQYRRLEAGTVIHLPGEGPAVVASVSPVMANLPGFPAVVHVSFTVPCNDRVFTRPFSAHKFVKVVSAA